MATATIGFSIERRTTSWPKASEAAPAERARSSASSAISWKTLRTASRLPRRAARRLGGRGAGGAPRARRRRAGGRADPFHGVVKIGLMGHREAPVDDDVNQRMAPAFVHRKLQRSGGSLSPGTSSIGRTSLDETDGVAVTEGRHGGEQALGKAAAEIVERDIEAGERRR